MTAATANKTASDWMPVLPEGSRNTRASGGSAGTHCGRTMAITPMNTAYRPANIKPGRMAPAYISPTD